MRVMVVSAHPDDETLGCGGTLLRHRDAGDDLTWLIATQGDPMLYGSDILWRKRQEIEAVAAAYPFSMFSRCGWPSGGVERVPSDERVGQMTSAIADLRPDVIYTVGDTDFHTDHGVTFEALMIAIKPFKWLRSLEVWAYEIPSSTEGGTFREQPFLPQRYVNVTDTLERKLDILDLYQTERQDWPLPRSRRAVESLSRWRGNSVGMEAAEAFRLVRKTEWE